MPNKIEEKLKIENGQVEAISIYEADNVKIVNEIENNNENGKGIKNKTLKNAKHYNYNINNIKEKKAVYSIKIKDNNKEFVVSFNQSDLEKGIFKSAKKRMKKVFANKQKQRLFSGLFVLLNIVILICILLYQKNTYGVLSFSQLQSMNISYTFIFLCFFAFFAMMVLEGIRTYVLVSKSTNAINLLKCIKMAYIERYYDMFIPACGGKAYSIVYLHKNKVKTSVASSIPIARAVFYSLATVLLSTAVIMLKWTIYDETSIIYLWLGIALICVNFLLVFFVLFLSISKKIAPKIIFKFLKFLNKLGLVKNYQEKFYNIMRFLLEFQKSVMYYFKSKSATIISLLSSCAVSFLIAVMPFLIAGIFAPVSWELLLEMLFTYYVLVMATKLIPIPGNVGVADITFASIFSPYFTGGTLMWALIIWRFFSYFLYIIQGVLVLLIEFIFGERNEKSKVNYKIKAESLN